jgi:hypothetical protein
MVGTLDVQIELPKSLFRRGRQLRRIPQVTGQNDWRAESVLGKGHLMPVARLEWRSGLDMLTGVF